MALPTELLNLLEALSPVQLGEATASLKRIHEQSEGLSSLEALRTMDLSVDPHNLRVVDCNQVTVDTLGMSPLGSRLLDLIDPEYRGPVGDTLESLRRQKEIKHVRLRFLRAGSDSVPVMMTAHGVKGDGGALVLIRMSCQDITSLTQLASIEAFSEMLSTGIALVDEEGRIVFTNSSAEKMFGYEQGELENQPVELLIGDVLRERHVKHRAEFFRELRRGLMAADRELFGRRKDGSEIALQIGLSSIRLAERRFAVASIADITERKSIERIVREHQRALIFSAGLVGDFTWNIDADEVIAHPTVFKLYGASPIAGPVPGAWFRARQHPDDMGDIRGKWLDRLAAESQLVLEFRINGDDGVTRWVECYGVVEEDAAGRPRQVHGLNVDITRSKLAEIAAQNAEKQLRIALQEKEAMLREIHHRVKNNLQIVSHLLGMQADNAGSSEAEAALRDSERRIATMAMIHEQLYGTDDLLTVELADHALQLSESLLASMAESPGITCRLDLTPVHLTIHQAIPCALILNELLTNAFKYAYPEGVGEITVHLSCIDNQVTLSVSDKGVGLPSSVDPKKPKTLGLEIVQVLAEQLDGELVVGRSPGASFLLHFERQNEVAADSSSKSATAGSGVQ